MAVMDEGKYDDDMTEFDRTMIRTITGHSGGTKFPASSLFEMYRLFCQEEGERFPLNNNKFAATISGDIAKRQLSRGNVYDLTTIRDL
jgi:hypothetical protein